MQTIQASYIILNNHQRIRLRFENDASLNKLIEAVQGARWSKTYKSWHIPCETKLYNGFKNNLPNGWLLTKVRNVTNSLAQTRKTTSLPLKSATVIKEIPTTVKPFLSQKLVQPDLNTANRLALQLYVQHMQLKAYSASTIKTYKSEL